MLSASAFPRRAFVDRRELQMDMALSSFLPSFRPACLPRFVRLRRKEGPIGRKDGIGRETDARMEKLSWSVDKTGCRGEKVVRIEMKYLHARVLKK